MPFEEDLAKLIGDHEIRSLARRRARSPELAEDTLQIVHWAVLRVSNPETISDLPAYVRTAVIREINRLHACHDPILVEDISDTVDLQQVRGSGTGQPPGSVEDEVAFRVLADELLTQFRLRKELLIASVPGRSPDQHRYRVTIVATARRILHLLLEGCVTSADWNAELKARYPQWCDEPGLTRDAIDQRLSRARSDVQALLRSIVTREELTGCTA
jgi:hypothetical protein